MKNTTKKARDLVLIALIYVLAYAVGVLSCLWAKSEILRVFVFDIVATLVTFVFSVLLHNSSVYDPYWSLTPMLVSVYLFASHGASSPWHLLFLAAFESWSLRLTVNWGSVTTGFSYEDWRYRKYRDENPPVLWFIINLFGIHLVPTLVVFGGMLPLFELASVRLGHLSLPGIAVILFGVALEFFADRQMHAHLHEAEKGTVCRRGLWHYSRHPNYLGEISVWVGTYLAMLPYSPGKWYYVIGAVSVAVLFNAVSVPLMETRQLSRRPDYAEYREHTSRLLLLPTK